MKAPVFPVPEARHTPFGRFPGIDGQRMSKSLGNTVNFTDPPEAVEQRLRRAAIDPQRVRSVNLDASPMIEGTLLGIKGQYLILDAGVLNVRRHGGYEVEVEAQGGNSMFRPS